MTLAALRGAVIVSCQAPPGSPLRAPEHMRAMAEAAVLGGARGIRAEGAGDVAAIRAAVEVPVIGLRKLDVRGTDVYITPTLDSAREIAKAGADLLALDATGRPRADGTTAGEFVRVVRSELDLPVLADVDGVEAGLRALDAGAWGVATTLAGYTDARPATDGPDLELLAALASRTDAPVIAEGRFSSPQDVARAFEAGAFAVVVGTAITNPLALTQRFSAAAPGRAASG
jgi:N-acylglucosamine-6-phosphate 2-epimerase